MKKVETLILTREDLIENSKDKRPFYLSRYDLKTSTQPYLEAGVVLFIEDNGDTYILKKKIR